MEAGGDLGSAANGSAIGLEVTGLGPVSCRFFIPFFFAMCTSLACLFIYHGTQTIFNKHTKV